MNISKRLPRSKVPDIKEQARESLATASIDDSTRNEAMHSPEVESDKIKNEDSAARAAKQLAKARQIGKTGKEAGARPVNGQNKDRGVRPTERATGSEDKISSPSQQKTAKSGLMKSMTAAKKSKGDAASSLLPTIPTEFPTDFWGIVKFIWKYHKFLLPIITSPPCWIACGIMLLLFIIIVVVVVIFE